MISPRASASGLPCSDVMISARSSAFATIRSYQARRSFARSWLVRFCQACWASADAAMACSTSAAPRLATRDVTRGRIRDGNDRPSVPSAHPDASHARVSSNAPSRSWARSTEGSIAWFVLLCISFTSTVSRNSCFPSGRFRADTQNAQASLRERLLHHPGFRLTSGIGAPMAPPHGSLRKMLPRRGSPRSSGDFQLGMKQACRSIDMVI